MVNKKMSLYEDLENIFGKNIQNVSNETNFEVFNREQIRAFTCEWGKTWIGGFSTDLYTSKPHRSEGNVMAISELLLHSVKPFMTKILGYPNEGETNLVIINENFSLEHHVTLNTAKKEAFLRNSWSINNGWDCKILKIDGTELIRELKLYLG